MTRKLPVLPTLIVLSAVAVMIGLGVWQLDRREQKAAMLAQYSAAASDTSVVDWPADKARANELLFRRARLTCASVAEMSAIAGKSKSGESGLSITAQCNGSAAGGVLVALGWSLSPVEPDWRGGPVVGVIGPGPRLIADPPLAGLEANAIPDPSEIPDNHLAYAVQWFFFAAVALLIYVLALRKRLAGTRRSG